MHGDVPILFSTPGKLFYSLLCAMSSWLPLFKKWLIDKNQLHKVLNTPITQSLLSQINENIKQTQKIIHCLVRKSNLLKLPRFNFYRKQSKLDVVAFWFFKVLLFRGCKNLLLRSVRICRSLFNMPELFVYVFWQRWRHNRLHVLILLKILSSNKSSQNLHWSSSPNTFSWISRYLVSLENLPKRSSLVPKSTKSVPVNLSRKATFF